MAPGDVLLVMTKDTPRGNWPIGRVLEVFPGPDNVVRVVNIQVGGKIYRRAVHSLIPLEVPEYGEEVDNSKNLLECTSNTANEV